jgi:predicted ArsR family transcriptional regulator
MPEEDPKRREVDQFILDEIDSVPHLEALLLLWNSRPRQWSLPEMAHALYVSTDQARPIMQDLARRGFVISESGQYLYREAPSLDDLIGRLDLLYRRELVRISNMIHSKPSSAVHAFARAFRFTKD